MFFMFVFFVNSFSPHTHRAYPSGVRGDCFSHLLYEMTRASLNILYTFFFVFPVVMPFKKVQNYELG